MVTDEMVEKAAHAMCEAWHYSKIGTPDGDAEWRKKQDQYRKQSRAALEAALSAQVQDVATHRHKKRGSEYVLIGTGKMQAENWRDLSEDQELVEGEEIGATVDMREVVIYRSVDDRTLWVRPVEEFNDGRFEPLAAAPAKQEG